MCAGSLATPPRASPREAKVPGKTFRRARSPGRGIRISPSRGDVAPGMAVALSTDPMPQSIRVAAVGDLHCTRTSEGAFQALFARIAEAADVLVLCGDLTDYGTAEEARVLVKELAAAKLPKLAVLGNHDFESNAAAEVTQILADAAGVSMLDGTATEVLGVGFAGVKGFAGGFGERALTPWGEEPIKAFVKAALDEALKLESALARLRTPGRVAVLHYAPIRETAGGESVEIFPFLGSSPLAEAVNPHPAGRGGP